MGSSIRNIDINGYLGSGGYSRVYAALDTSNGQQRAVKVCLHAIDAARCSPEDLAKDANYMVRSHTSSRAYSLLSSACVERTSAALV